MIIYLAGAESMYKTLKSCDAKNVLVSYFYLREKGTKSVERILKDFPNVFLDSGAFTLRQTFTKDSAMPSASQEHEWVLKYMDDYVDFIKRYGSEFRLIAELDVGTWQQKTRYREMLEDRLPNNITLLPVVHRADPNNYVDYLCNNYPYVAYAGLKGYSVNENRRYMSKRVIIAKKKQTMIHGFALTAVDIMKNFGLASVDSASWLHGKLTAMSKLGKNGEGCDS